MNALQAIRHVRFGDMWEKVQDPETILQDRSRNAAGRLVADPARGAAQRAPGLGHERVRGRELDGRVPERDPAKRCLAESTAVVIVWDDFGGFYDHVVPPALRHHGPRPADAGADHLAVDAPG